MLRKLSDLMHEALARGLGPITLLSLKIERAKILLVKKIINDNINIININKYN